MYICRLFHRDQPFQQIDARVLSEGSITIGRDPAADWPLPDLDGAISRLHCTLSVADGGLQVVDASTNGTFLDGGHRAPRDTAVPLGVHESIHLGALTIVIDQPDDAALDADATCVRLPMSTALAPAPTDWSDPAPAAPAPHRDASLLEAFCEGARLDASALSAEDPVELMRRIGAIYQQTVLGLATLMAERSRLKAQYELDRTTIGAADNNPFKWTPTRRLAQDLLCATPEGFLSDVAAVRACFDELRLHLSGVAAGAEAAASVTLQTLAPQAIAAEAAAEGFSLRGKAASCWDIHARRHQALLGPGGLAVRAFGEAYRNAAAPE